MQPFQLLLADEAVRIGDVVQRDEVHALVVEAVEAVAEDVLVHLAVVQAGVVLAGNEAHVLDLQLADDGLELLHAALAFLVVGRGVRQVAGEHDEVGLVIQAVDRGDGLAQRVVRFRIRRPFETPVRIGHLHEGEVLAGRGHRPAPRTQAAGQHRAAQAGKFEEVTTFDLAAHGHHSKEERRKSTPSLRIPRPASIYSRRAQKNSSPKCRETARGRVGASLMPALCAGGWVASVVALTGWAGGACSVASSI